MDGMCKYCKKEFSTKYTLSRHQQTNAKCLKLRNKEKVTETCEYCENEFIHLAMHKKKCKNKAFMLNHRREIGKLQTKLVKNKSLEKDHSKLSSSNKKLKDENTSLRDKISELEGVIIGLKTAPDKKTIYNTAIHPKLVNLPIDDIPALTQEYMIERVNDGILTYEKASKGYSGILEVISDLITHENSDGTIGRSYVCTDASRNSFHRLLASKEWKSDKGGRYLNNILDTFQDVMEEYKDKVYETYKSTPHESIEWGQVEWERKNVFLLYGGISRKEGTSSRDELVNILRKEISKRAYV